MTCAKVIISLSLATTISSHGMLFAAESDGKKSINDFCNSNIAETKELKPVCKNLKPTTISGSGDSTAGQLIDDISIVSDTTSSEGRINIVFDKRLENGIDERSFNLRITAPINRNTRRSQFITETGIPNSLGLTASFSTSFTNPEFGVGEIDKMLQEKLEIENKYKKNCDKDFLKDIMKKIAKLKSKEGMSDQEKRELKLLNAESKKRSDLIKSEKTDVDTIGKYNKFCEINRDIYNRTESKIIKYLDNDLDIINKIKEYKNISQKFIAPIIELDQLLFNATGTIAVSDFNFRNSVDFQTTRQREVPFSLAASVGYVPKIKNPFIIYLGAEYRQNYRAANTQIICPPGAENVECFQSAFAPPTQNIDSRIFTGFRLLTPDGKKIPRFGIEARISYDINDNEFGAEVPIYLVRNSTSGLTGGFRVAYTSDNGDGDDDFLFGIFVSQPFSLNF